MGHDICFSCSFDQGKQFGTVELIGSDDLLVTIFLWKEAYIQDSNVLHEAFSRGYNCP